MLSGLFHLSPIYAFCRSLFLFLYFPSCTLSFCLFLFSWTLLRHLIYSSQNSIDGHKTSSSCNTNLWIAGSVFSCTRLFWIYRIFWWRCLAATVNIRSNPYHSNKNSFVAIYKMLNSIILVIWICYICAISVFCGLLLDKLING